MCFIEKYASSRKEIFPQGESMYISIRANILLVSAANKYSLDICSLGFAFSVYFPSRLARFLLFFLFTRAPSIDENGRGRLLKITLREIAKWQKESRFWVRLAGRFSDRRARS